MGNIDNLDFNLIIHDEEFGKKIQRNVELAKKFNIAVSDLLEVQSKIEGISADQAKAAKTQVAMMNMQLSEQDRSAIRLAKAKADIQNRQIIGLQRLATEEQKTADVAKKSAADQLLIQQKLATEKERTSAATTRAKIAEEQLNKSRKRAATEGGSLIKTLGGINSQFSVQNRLISNATTLFASYVSVFALERFISNLARVRGEFELQQVALRAIMQDVAQADKTFGQLKNLAVESPFRFKELTQYAKMLSAYNIANEDLFKTTKQIADLSAGLGVGMDRLILAYGQVRSAEFLRGQEVRQFSEAGINLVGELAKKFTELEGTVVSAGEVFDRISNRMVTFEMVRDVIDDLTSEGGRFFDQQRMQANTLFGMIQKLADAYDIMLNDIGQANEGTLKSGVGLLLSLIKHWRMVAAVLGSVTTAYLAYKAVSSGYKAWEWALKTAEALKQTKAALIGATEAQIALNRAAKANAYAALVGIILGIATAIYSAVSAAGRFNRELEAISSGKISKLQDDIYTLEKLVKAVDTNVKGTHEYNKALSDLRRRFGDYIPDLDEAIERNELLANKIDGVSEALKSQSFSAAMEETKSKIDEQYADNIAKSISKIQNQISKIRGITNEAAAEITGQLTAQIEKDIKDGADVNFSHIQTLLFRLIKEAGLSTRYWSSATAAGWGADLARNLTEKFEAQELATIRLNAHYKVLGTNIEATAQQMKDLADAEANYQASVENINNDPSVDPSERKYKLREERIKFLETVIKDVFPQGAQAAKQYADELRNLEYTASGLAGIYNALIKRSTELNEAQKQSLYVQNNQSFTEKIKSTTAFYEQMIKRYNDLQKEIATAESMPQLFTFGYEGNISKMKEEAEQIIRTATATKKILDAISQQKTTTDHNSSQIQALEAEIKRVQELQRAYDKLNKIMSSEQAIAKLKQIDGFTNILTETLVARAPEIATAMNGMFEGNVDLLSRPFIDAAELVKKGWEDAGEGIATVFSSQYGILDAQGNEREILVTPILPDGSVLSPNELDEYIHTVLENSDNILEADKKQIVIGIDVDADGSAGELLHNLQEQFYLSNDDLDFEKTIEPTLLKMEALGEAGRKAADKIREGFARARREKAIKGIEDDVKSMFKSLKDDLADYQEKYKMLQDLTKMGFGKQEAIDLSFGALGGTPDLNGYLAESIEKLLSASGQSVELNPDMALSFKEQLSEVFDSLTEDEKQYIENADNIRQSDFANRLKEGLELINQTRTTSDKIAAIKEESAQRIAQYEEDIAAGRVNQETGNRMIEATKRVAAEQIAALESESLKLTDFYERLFGTIEKYSTRSLETIRKRTQQALESAVFDQEKKQVTMSIVADDGSIKETIISMEQYLSMVQQLGKVNETLSDRNPFKAFLMDLTASNLAIKTADDKLEAFNTANASALDEIAAKKKANIERTAEETKLEKQQERLQQNAADARKDKMAAVGAEVGKIGEGINQITSSAAGMFESLGLDELGDAVGFVGELSSGISNIAKSAMSGDVMGAISGVFSVFTSVFRYHDKKLDRAIERSKLRVKQLENAYKNLQYAVDNALGSERYAYTGEQISNLQKQYQEVSSQLDNERKKKDSDKGAIIDYEQQLVELRQEMEQLIKTIAEDILGTSIADLASQLGNAFIEAFATGENAAAAWGKKVDEIVADIIRRMIIQKYLEPQLAKTLKKYIGTVDEEGNWDLLGAGNNVISNVISSMPELADELKGLGSTFGDLWESLDPMLRDLAGGGEGASSLAEGIKGVSEDTANLLASYINAMRQEQSLQGVTLNQIRNLLSINIQNGLRYLQHLQNIEAYTYDNARAANEILRRLNSVITSRVGGAGNAINVNA